MAGRRAVAELIAAGQRGVREVLVASGATGPGIGDIVEAAGSRGVPVRELARDAIGRQAGIETHQGVVAFAEPLSPADLSALSSAADGTALVVALDGVSDPHNVGAIIRSAESAGATGAVLARHGGPAVTPTVAKAAAGAIEHLPLAVVSRIPAALERLKSQGLWVVGIDADGEDELFGLPLLSEPVVLVLGSEGTGMSRLAAQRCDVRARIPRMGRTASLNVSTAAALACYEALRVRGD